MGYFIDKIKKRRIGLLSVSIVFRKYEELIIALDSLITKLEDESQSIYMRVRSVFIINKYLKYFERINANEKQLNIIKEKIIEKLDSVNDAITREYYLERLGMSMESISNVLGNRLYIIPRLVVNIDKQIKNKVVGLWEEINIYYKAQEKIVRLIDIVEDSSLRLRQRKKIIFRQRLDNYNRVLNYKSVNRVTNMLDTYEVDFKMAKDKNNQDIEASIKIIKDLFSRLDTLKDKYPDYYNANNLESVQNNLLKLRGEANKSKYVLDKINNYDVEVYTIERELPMLNFSKEILEQRKSSLNHTIDALPNRTQNIDTVRQLKSKIGNLKIDLERERIMNIRGTILNAKDKLISKIAY